MSKLISKTRSAARLGLAVLVTAMCQTQFAAAETPAKPSAPAVPAPATATPAATPAVAAPHVPIPDNSKLTLMIQLHVAALSLADLTNNYTVLHALGSPAFQAANPPAKLAEEFGGFRKQGIDISPALLFAPILVGQPRMEANDVVRVVGFYATTPQRIVFELAFQPVNNAWRLADIKVRTVVAPVAPVAPVAQAAPVTPAPTTAAAPAADAKPAATKAAAKK